MEFVVLAKRYTLYWLLFGLLLFLSATGLLAQVDETADPGSKGAHLVIDGTDSEPDDDPASVTIPTTQITTLSDRLAADDAYTLVGNSPQMADVFGGLHESDTLIFVSSGGNGRVNGIAYRDEDILAYNPATSVWQLFFDASDVGILSDVNGFTFLVDGTLLLTLNESEFIPGVGEIQNTDVVRFIPTRWGDETNGRFEMVFDGSDVGLVASSEEIDALHVLEDGRLLFSSRGRVRIGERPRQFKAADEDLLLFTPTQLGHDTAGSWSIYQSGLALGFDKTHDILALWQDGDSGEIIVTTDSTVFNIIDEAGMRTDPLVYAGSSLDVNIQANVNSSNFSLAAANSSGFKNFDGLAIVGP